MSSQPAKLACSACSDRPASGRNSLKPAEMLACSDRSDCSNRKGDGRAAHEAWSPAIWRARRRAAAAEQEIAGRIAFYSQAIADATEALAAPDAELDAERAVMAAVREQETDQSCTSFPEVA